MSGFNVHAVLSVVQHSISIAGVLIILFGIVVALFQYLRFAIKKQLQVKGEGINSIRLNLGRNILLGLEFIVAADLIGSVTAPDYYSVGLLAIIVVLRTLLSFSINREIVSLSKDV